MERMAIVEYTITREQKKKRKHIQNPVSTLSAEQRGLEKQKNEAAKWNNEVTGFEKRKVHTHHEQHHSRIIKTPRRPNSRRVYA